MGIATSFQANSVEQARSNVTYPCSSPVPSSKIKYGGPKGGLVIGVDSKPQNLATAEGWDNVTGVGEPNGIRGRFSNAQGTHGRL